MYLILIFIFAAIVSAISGSIANVSCRFARSRQWHIGWSIVLFSTLATDLLILLAVEQGDLFRPSRWDVGKVSIWYSVWFTCIPVTIVALPTALIVMKRFRKKSMPEKTPFNSPSLPSSFMMAVVISVFLLCGCKIFRQYESSSLDSSKRAHQDNWGLSLNTTRSQFLSLQHAYRPETFDAWTNRLALLHTGMTREEIKETLHPKSVDSGKLITSGIRIDYVILDDAYFTGIAVSPKTDKMLWATHPIAISYRIYPDALEP